MGCLSKFFLTATPPNTYHQLNALETIGNTFLIPINHAAGTFSIKCKEDESLLGRKVASIALAIFSLPLTVIGILLKGIGQIWPHKEIHATDLESTSIQLTDQNTVAQCYKLAGLFYNICGEQGFVNEDGIPDFVMNGGTALGAERHGGMIPWDDDCDFIVFDEAGFLAMEPAFNAAGLEIDRSLRFNSMYKLKFTQKKLQELFPDVNSLKSADIDIFVWSKMGDGSYTHDTTYSRSNWPTDYFTPEEVAEGFELKQFGPIALPGLKTPEQYLKRYYGENCLTHGIETHGHAKICGVAIPFMKFGAHYFLIEKYKGPAVPKRLRM